MQCSLILGLFLILLAVAGIIGVLRILYGFLSASPETGDTEVGVTIYLKGKTEVEQVLRAAKEIRDVFFPSAKILIRWDEGFKEKDLAESAAAFYGLEFEEISRN